MPLNALSYEPPTMDSLQPKNTIQILVTTNPMMAAKINVDGTVYTAPVTLNLAPGQHSFNAVSTVAQQYVTYGFECWYVNGSRVSNMPTALINCYEGCTVTAQYMLAESGWGAPAKPDSLPNPNGPMTANLILNNPNPTAYKEV